MEVKRKQEEEERKRREEEERRIQVGVGSVAAGRQEPSVGLCCFNPVAVCRWLTGWIYETQFSAEGQNNRQTDH